MRCTQPGCQKVWNIQLGIDGLPDCDRSGCGLQMWAHSYMGGAPSGIPGNVPNYEPGPDQSQGVTTQRRSVQHPLNKHLQSQSGPVSCSSVGLAVSGIHKGIEGIQEYKLNARNATTNTRWPGGQKSFATACSQPQMHSEMEAIKYMLANGHWIMINGEIFTSTGKAVSPQDFTTGDMHCGWCTLFIQVLGLPLSSPSDGNFNQAVNLGYPMPDCIKGSPFVLAKFISSTQTGWLGLKLLFDKCLTQAAQSWYLKDYSGNIIGTAENGLTAHIVPPTEITNGMPIISWEQIIGLHADLLNEVWRFVFNGIYQKLRG